MESSIMANSSTESAVSLPKKYLFCAYGFAGIESYRLDIHLIEGVLMVAVICVSFNFSTWSEIVCSSAFGQTIRDSKAYYA